MMHRLLSLVLMMCFLAGCVIQTKAPLFTDADVTDNPVSGEQAFFKRESGEWKRSDETINFEPSAKHFIVRDKDSEVAVTVVHLSANWFVMQAYEKDKPTIYSLFERQSEGGLIHFLLCEDLKKDATAAAKLNFENDLCILKDGIDAQSYFTNLIASAGEPDIRLVPSARAD